MFDDREYSQEEYFGGVLLSDMNEHVSNGCCPFTAELFNSGHGRAETLHPAKAGIFAQSLMETMQSNIRVIVFCTSHLKCIHIYT